MKKMSKGQFTGSLVVGFVSLLFAACAQNPTIVEEPAEPDTGTASSAEVSAFVVEKSQGYLVQPGDVLTISVWNEEELQREVIVRPDGGITFPLIGDVEASGKSIRALRAEVTEGLSRFIPEAAVSVNLKQVVGNKINVLGQVKAPGEFVLTSGTDVLQALSMAGGVTAFANMSNIKILRRDKVTREQTVIPFNYKKILRGRGLEQNILLFSGDTIVVP